MIVEPAPAKINLALHVRARRPDGYHDIETLFAFVEHGDEIRLDEGEGFTVSGPFAAALAAEGDNLVTRAARLFGERFGVAATHRIELVKRLPVASGIGGGSADAAATLRALARRHGIALEDKGLTACAEQLGADVPACLFSTTALGTGRGAQLRPVVGLPGLPALLVNPGVAVSTAQVFALWGGIDRGPIAPGPMLDRAIAGRNDLEAPALQLAPVISEVLALLRAQRSAPLVRMSGSGATCFALYLSDEARTRAAEALRKQHPEWWCLETALV